MATTGTASIEAKIKAQETKLKQLKAQKQQIEMRQRAAAAKINRQQDTRRKVLVGAVILAKVERGEWPKEKLLTMLDSTLTRLDDRALFELSPEVFSTVKEPAKES